MEKTPSRHEPCALEALECRMHFHVAGTGLVANRFRFKSPPAPKPIVIAPSPLAGASSGVGSPYAIPTNPQTVIPEDASWKFQLNAGAVSGKNPQDSLYNDSSFSSISLPHTWNATSSNTGLGWYRKIISVASNLLNGPELFLQFAGAYSVTSLYIDGTQIDYNPNASGTQAHGGGFAAFTFDVTSALNAPVPNGLSGHLIAVAVNNDPKIGVTGASDSSVSPVGGGDYVHQGGIYRDVTLIATNAVHVPLNEKDPNTNVPVTGGGVYFTNLSTVAIGAASANFAVTTLLDNQSTSQQPVNVTSYLVDAAGTIQATATSPVTIPASQTTDLTAANPVDLVQTATINNPHLWDGRIDPYLYTLYVEVRSSSTNALLDLSQQKVGIRSFLFNSSPTGNQAPFMLNGHAYTLVGADIHQDSGALDASGNPVGWAQSASQIQSDVNTAVDLGATVFRTSHYQESQTFYSYCDQVGIMVYTEDGTNGTLGGTGSAELLNTEDQLTELIKQNYNHASVFAFGLANETDNSLVASFTALNTLGHSVDKLSQYTTTIPQTHETAFAQYGGTGGSATAVVDIMGTHRYDYWYGGNNGAVGNVQNTEQNTGNPTINGTKQPLAITEMGGGASAYQYTDNSIALPVSNVTTHYHPVNQQTLVEESQWADLMNPGFGLNFLWGKVVWQLFDMTDFKAEGDASGINDKGLVTRFRVKKDSYYFYQAQWNQPGRNYDSQKVIHISDQFWTARNSPTPRITVFSNMGAPTLSVNGTSLGTMTPLTVTSTGTMANVSSQSETVPNTYVLTLSAAQALAVGKNSINASVVYSGDGQTYSDAATWSYYAADGSYQTTATLSRTFTYDNVHQTTSNPFVVSGLTNGIYDVKISSPSGGDNNLSLNGQTVAIDTNGLSTADTYYTRVAVTNNSLSLGAAPGAYNAAMTSMSYSLVDTVAPTVSGMIVNGGAAQRSMINGLGLQFGKPVALQSGAASLGLRNTAGGGYSATFPLTATNPSNDGMNYVLTLSSGANLNTLADGLYDLNVDQTKVSDSFGLNMASAYTSSFHRLFGDSNGDKYVDNIDLIGFRTAFLGGASAYNPIFDFDNDGVIGSVDLTALKLRLGTHLLYS